MHALHMHALHIRAHHMPVLHMHALHRLYLKFDFFLVCPEVGLTKHFLTQIFFCLSACVCLSVSLFLFLKKQVH